jgi:hypothetical protein
MNANTGYVDGSQIYGSDTTLAGLIRDGCGKLKVTPGPNGDLLPILNADGTGNQFTAGDNRVRENPLLQVSGRLLIDINMRVVFSDRRLIG